MLSRHESPKETRDARRVGWPLAVTAMEGTAGRGRCGGAVAVVTMNCGFEIGATRPETAGVRCLAVSARVTPSRLAVRVVPLTHGAKRDGDVRWRTS